MNKDRYDKPKYEIGSRIQYFRKAKNISQKELAEMLGVSNGRVSNWEQGLNRPDADLIAGICSALSVSPSELLDIRITDDDFTGEEREIIKAYRSKPELQHAVKVLLGVNQDSES